MANPEHLAILKQGVEVWNRWREVNKPILIDLTRTYLSGDLSGADLRRAYLSGADLARANLSGADLTRANFAGATLTKATLRGADLRGAKLTKATLRKADLQEADLTRTNFAGATLADAYLTRATLTDADLSETNLQGADLRRADLSGAHLTDANLTRANLTGANLTGANLGCTSFGIAKLTEITGLDTCNHHAPSILGNRTLAQNPHLSKVFLRGCGLSDLDIKYAKLYRPGLSNAQINDIVYKIFDLRATQAIQISPLFLSYNHEDSGFIDQVEPEFNNRGIRFWRDIHHATSGRLERQVDRAIRHNPTVLLVLSEHSVNSDWVQYEVRVARKLEIETGRDVLCPVALDDAWKTCRWPARLREQVEEYMILDFSAWKKKSAFTEQFDKLLRGLRIFYEEEEAE